MGAQNGISTRIQHRSGIVSCTINDFLTDVFTITRVFIDLLELLQSPQRVVSLEVNCSYEIFR